MKIGARRSGGLSAAALGVSLATNLLCVPATASTAFPTNKTTSGQSGAAPVRQPLALRGTDLLQHAANIEGVDGNPDYVIDQSQYDQAKAYFLQRIAATPSLRDKLWQPNFSSLGAYKSSIGEHRQHLRQMLGWVELNPQKAEVKILSEGAGITIEEIRITLDGDFGTRALLFLPKSAGRIGTAVAIPRADQTPEAFAGIAEGMATAPWLRTLLASGVAVAIPQMLERVTDHALCVKAGGQDERRVLWRMGFIVGRTLVGMEVQQVVALADYLASRPEIDSKKIAVWGGEQGGMTALYAAAIDENLAGAVVLDYFQQRQESWKEPVDRTIYGQLNEFGDAEVAALISPRKLTIVTEWQGQAGYESVRAETARARRFYRGLDLDKNLQAQEISSGGEEASSAAVISLLGAEGKDPVPEIDFRVSQANILKARNAHFEALHHYAQHLFEESETVRTNYWKLASTPPQDRPQKVEKLRKELGTFEGEVPGQDIPLHPRTLLVGETDKFLAYDVVLNTVPGVEAYGQLLIPRSVAGRAGKPLPAVVCQHGFGGAPEFVTGIGRDVKPENHNDLYYRRFGQRLAERGYVVFAPYVTVPVDVDQPQYVYRSDLINPLVREAAAIGMMRTGLEVAKLHRIMDFLQSLPFVDGQRIGYYGLSYGGYSAVWMPPLEPRLQFTIISGFFNHTRSDLTSEDSRNSYWSSPDFDFYGWNLLNRFTQTELIATMWPRPVSIEWGLTDPTTTPEWHKLGWEDLKQKFIDPWGMADKVVDTDYIGPHTIHGVGTFFFIDRWLRPERSAGRDYGCGHEQYCNWDVDPGLYGYAPNPSVPFVTQLVDSQKESVIRGRFYVSNLTPDLLGMGLKLSRTGDPGDLIVKLGSQEGASDIGELRLQKDVVYPTLDLWYDLKMEHSIRLDPKKLYWFEVTSSSGQAPQDAYTVYGPKPLGAEDYPNNFGLSFRILTNGSQ